MTPFPLRLTTGLVALTACIAFTSCESTKPAGSDDLGVIDYTSGSGRKSDAEKASYPFDEAGNYREDWVAKSEGATGVRDTPVSAAYTQEPDETPVRTTVASSSSSGARKSTGSSSGSSARKSTSSSSKPKPKPKPKPAAKPTYVKVKSGDTLYGLSRQYGVSVAAIKSANGLKSDTIVDGKSLKIPKKK